MRSYLISTKTISPDKLVREIESTFDCICIYDWVDDNHVDFHIYECPVYQIEDLEDTMAEYEEFED